MLAWLPVHFYTADRSPNFTLASLPSRGSFLKHSTLNPMLQILPDNSLFPFFPNASTLTKLFTDISVNKQ